MQLDQLLVRGEELDRTPLAWLGELAAANSSKAILAELKKLDFLRELGVAEWDLSTINPNRLKFLAQLGRKATSQALQRLEHDLERGHHSDIVESLEGEIHKPHGT